MVHAMSGLILGCSFPYYRHLYSKAMIALPKLTAAWHSIEAIAFTQESIDCLLSQTTTGIACQHSNRTPKRHFATRCCYCTNRTFAFAYSLQLT